MSMMRRGHTVVLLNAFTMVTLLYCLARGMHGPCCAVQNCLWSQSLIHRWEHDWVDLDPSLLPQCWSSSTVACSKLRVALSEQMLTEVVAWFRDRMHVVIII